MPLSFFTNSGNSYGSSIPFQRIVEPAQLGFFLNLEQAELLRVQRYNEHWRFYYGKHWIFDREDGEPLVTLNYFKKFIDKSVDFLTSKGFSISVPDALTEITKPFLDEVWEYNGRDALAHDIATMGSVTGDAFILVTYEEPNEMQRKVNPFSQGKIRLNLLGSEQVYPTWDPLNVDTLTAVRIETIYYAERGNRQLDREDRVNHEGRQLYTKRFTQIISPTEIVEQYHGEMPTIKPNVLGEISLAHIKNFSVPKEYYGMADGQDLIDLNRELNEKSTDISDTINYHSAPITLIYGAKAKNLERGPRALWSGLPTDARVENLQLGGDLNAANNYWDRLKKVMHELGDIPEGALGEKQAISNTSGVALHMQYQPLIEKTRRKKLNYEPGFEQINYFILRIGMVMGLINLPFDIDRHSGGRIVEVLTGETTHVWNPETEAYMEVPVRKKRAFQIDKETLEFLDPAQVKLKYWREYGFGGHLVELPLDQIAVEVMDPDFRSFWDYAVADRLEEEKYREDLKQVRERNSMAAATPAEPQMDAEGNEIPAPPTPNAEPEPQPPVRKIQRLPMGEVDVPPEPEEVDVIERRVNPQTGETITEVVVKKFLVPVDTKKTPHYLSPFENDVKFQDTLPKDEALQATLYEQYQNNGWVDQEWVRERIPEIRPEATEIAKRIKAAKTSGQAGDPGTNFGMPPQNGPPQNELSPEMGEQPGMVPGQGGNPVPPGQGGTV